MKSYILIQRNLRGNLYERKPCTVRELSPESGTRVTERDSEIEEEVKYDSKGRVVEAPNKGNN